MQKILGLIAFTFSFCKELFCGSEGLFGIGLEITLRLLPKPEKFHTVLVGYHSLQAAGDAVSAVKKELPSDAERVM